MGGLWSIMTIVGPIVLALVLIYALLKNRRHSGRAEIERTEQATRRLQEEIARDEKKEKP